MDKDVNYNRIKSSLEFIVANFKKQPRIEEIASHVNLSEFHFQRIFKEWAGISPKKFLQYITLKELKKSIHNANSLLQLSGEMGLSSQSRIYDLFVKIESVTPEEYRTKGNGINIVFGIHETPLGKCLIANTKRGICAVEFINNEIETTLGIFKNKWKNASILESHDETKPVIDKLFRNKGGSIKALLNGTPFQVKVWEALLKIPYGNLTTYSEIADIIDKPKACRAVGCAIGKNNIAVLIPCHRVIQSSGYLGGYKWGEERKIFLIGNEKKNTISEQL